MSSIARAVAALLAVALPWIAARAADEPATPAAARASAGAARSRARQAVSCMEEQSRRSLENSREAGEAATEHAGLVDEKRRAMKEFAQGLFCSKCDRAASEIERVERMSFGQHLDKVQGVPKPAPVELVKRKAAEYDRKIAQARQRLDRHHAEWDQIRQRHASCDAQRVAADQEATRLERVAKRLEAEGKRRAAAEALRRAQESARIERERARAEAERQAQARREAAEEALRAQLDEARRLQEFWAGWSRQLTEAERAAREAEETAPTPPIEREARVTTDDLARWAPPPPPASADGPGSTEPDEGAPRYDRSGPTWGDVSVREQLRAKVSSALERLQRTWRRIDEEYVKPIQYVRGVLFDEDERCRFVLSRIWRAGEGDSFDERADAHLCVSLRHAGARGAEETLEFGWDHLNAVEDTTGEVGRQMEEVTR
jgi:hypothetical protein